MLLYSRKKVRYRRDGYCWKKRKDGKTTREDHMKLKVQGTEVVPSIGAFICNNSAHMHLVIRARAHGSRPRIDPEACEQESGVYARVKLFRARGEWAPL